MKVLKCFATVWAVVCGGKAALKRRTSRGDCFAGSIYCVSCVVKFGGDWDGIHCDFWVDCGEMAESLGAGVFVDDDFDERDGIFVPV